jgi:hypothetical protein
MSAAARALRGSAAAFGLALLLASAAQAQLPALPIPGPGDLNMPAFEGVQVKAHPLRGPFLPPNPWLAPDGRSGTGLAAGNGAASPLSGPLGAGSRRASAIMFGTCAGLAFDAHARLLAVCNGVMGPALRLVDPASLVTLATLNLPPRPNADRTDLAGGTNFVVRADGSLLLPANDGTLKTLSVEGNAFRQTASQNLAGSLVRGERPYAVSIGYDGRVWVAGNQGTVVVLNRDGAQAGHIALHEDLAEDIATDRTGTYVVTRQALYRLAAARTGAPAVVWREPLAGAERKGSGRVHFGTGTPPAVVPGGYVAVAEASDPPRVVVARIGGPAAKRRFCSVPVFAAGKGAVEAHLVVAGHSIVVSNSHGYDNLLVTEGGSTTTGGLTRVDVGKRGCRIGWTSREISPTAQPVLSRATGLLYTMAKPREFPDRWALAGIDWRTGATRFRQLSGEGLGFNSEGGPVVIGPDGNAYAGSFGGIERIGDTAPQVRAGG